MIKAQLITMHRTAPSETAHILSHTAQWQHLAPHYDRRRRKFDDDGIQNDPKCIETISKLAQSLQRTRGIEQATTIPEALRNSPHWTLCEVLDHAGTAAQFREVAAKRFADMPGYSGNPSALLKLGGLDWKTKFEARKPKARPQEGKGEEKPPKAATKQAMVEEMRELRNIVKDFVVTRMGANEEEILSLARLIQGEAATRKGESMPQFHETIAGHRFYEAQLPRLIKAGESIAKSLESIAKSLELIAADHAAAPPQGQKEKGHEG